MFLKFYVITTWRDFMIALIRTFTKNLLTTVILIIGSSHVTLYSNRSTSSQPTQKIQWKNSVH